LFIYIMLKLGMKNVMKSQYFHVHYEGINLDKQGSKENLRIVKGQSLDIEQDNE
jgi:hypothetical protein